MMNKILMCIAWLSVFLMAGLCGCDNKLGEKIPDDYFDDQNGGLAASYIFKKGDDNYSCFRIPALVKTTNGVLLAFAEARKNSCSDAGDIDMVLKRSEDGGKSWSDMVVLWDEGEHTCGNPAPVVDEQTGDIHLLACLDNDRVFVLSSTDNGVKWSEPREITSTVKKENWTWYATGPVHGIQLKKGTNAGRLVVACDHTGDAHTIYSADHGETWKLGGITEHPVFHPNESTVAELSDGRLMLNMRCSNSNNRRLTSVSDDGGMSWSTPQVNETLIDPVCQGSSYSATSADGVHRLFFANPAHESSRRNMTLRLSTDDGKTFSKSYTVYTEFAAYSDMTLLDDDRMAMLYERGAADANEGIVFEIIPLSNLN
ncbi:hypothetical protein GCM10023231_26830 [Olivibacter ginsenosidimutans]|uniref:exo-alpha-sialidase n=1 Tax=Olivibacter ginsenosidimutans TaxID=1176537 RepID=A0ABP9BKM0_9SPHI